MENPEKIEIEGLKTIHKLCNFGADHNMEGCTFTEIVERMFSKIEQMKTQVNTLDEMLLNQGEVLAQAKAQAVPEWISVEDRLPSEGQDIIAFDAIKHCVFKDGEFLQGYFEPDTGHEYTEPVDVTHWIAIEPQEPAND